MTELSKFTLKLSWISYLIIHTFRYMHKSINTMHLTTNKKYMTEQYMTMTPYMASPEWDSIRSWSKSREFHLRDLSQPWLVWYWLNKVYFWPIHSIVHPLSKSPVYLKADPETQTIHPFTPTRNLQSTCLWIGWENWSTRRKTHTCTGRTCNLC